MTVTHDGKEHSINPNHRKCKHFSMSYIGIAVTDNGVKEVCDLRVYETESTCHACLWVRGGDYVSGSGRATGCGYHMSSSAADTAIRAAGYALSESIDGRGEGAIREAIEAICRYHCPDSIIHVVHAHA